jgi:mannitol-specific phosphotransferase system IIBC component
MLALNKPTSCRGAILIEVLCAALFFIATSALLLHCQTNIALQLHAIEQKEKLQQHQQDKKLKASIETFYEQQWQYVSRFGNLTFKSTQQ